MFIPLKIKNTVKEGNLWSKECRSKVCGAKAARVELFWQKQMGQLFLWKILKILSLLWCWKDLQSAYFIGTILFRLDVCATLKVFFYCYISYFLERKSLLHIYRHNLIKKYIIFCLIVKEYACVYFIFFILIVHVP